MIYCIYFRFWLNSHRWSMSRTFTSPSCASPSSPPQPSCTNRHWLISSRSSCQMSWLWSDHHSCKVRFVVLWFICLRILWISLLFTQFHVYCFEKRELMQLMLRVSLVCFSYALHDCTHEVKSLKVSCIKQEYI